MKSAAHDTALYLYSNSIGVFPPPTPSAGWAIDVGVEATLPTDFITVYDTGGDGSDTDELDIQRPTIQIRVRSLSYEEAFNKQKAIKDLLVGRAIEMDSSDVIGIIDLSDIQSLGRDDHDRHILVANYRVIRTEKE